MAARRTWQRATREDPHVICHDPARAMNDLHALPFDLWPTLWVLGALAVAMLLLHFAERLAHTRARNRTRRAIEISATPEREELQKKL